MKSGYKKILIVWLVLYILLTFIDITKLFDQNLLKDVLSISTVSVKMSTMILFIFIGIKGDEKFAKYGVISLIVYFALCLLQDFSIFKGAGSGNIINNVFDILYYISSGITNILEYIALFSLIDDNKKVDSYKIGSIICVGIAAILNIFLIGLPYTKYKNIYSIETSIVYVATALKFVAFVIYLIDDNYVSKIFVKDENNQYQPQPKQESQQIQQSQQVVQQNQSTINQQYTQQYPQQNQYDMNQQYAQQYPQQNPYDINQQYIQQYPQQNQYDMNQQYAQQYIQQGMYGVNQQVPNNNSNTQY